MKIRKVTCRDKNDEFLFEETYDKNGNVITYKDCCFADRVFEYDEKGNKIHEIDHSFGFETWYKYDEQGRLIYGKCSDGEEYFTTYYENGKVANRKYVTWLDETYDYDLYGNLVHSESKGFERWYEYDEKGNEIHRRDSKGYESWIDYDENGNKIHVKDSEGNETWWDYNENDKPIHSKNSKGEEEWCFYDEEGLIICSGNNYNEKRFYEYEYFDE